MPRKKKEEEISNKIVNWYEKIPDELLDKKHLIQIIRYII